MPMGISSAPALFQRFINSVLRDTGCIPRRHYSIFIELRRARGGCSCGDRQTLRAKCKTSFEKSKLVSEKIEFLGNTIERGEIKMLPKRATGLQNMKTPKTLADLQRLLGMANNSRTYIPKYAELLKPLYDLMDLKNVPENLKKKTAQQMVKKQSSIGMTEQWKPSTN